MNVECAGALVQVAGEIVQVDPRPALDGFRGVADRDAEFEHRVARPQIGESDLVSEVHGFEELEKLVGRTAHQFDRAGDGVVQ